MSKAPITNTKLEYPFAVEATYKNSIPSENNNSTSNLASLYGGFPPKTFLPATEDGGGIPPSGADFNGILYWITQLLYNTQNGFTINEYDPTYQVQQSGYSKYATLWYTSTSTGRVLIQSLVDNNLQVPYSGTTLQNQWKLAVELPKYEDYLPDYNNVINLNPSYINANYTVTSNGYMQGDAILGTSGMWLKINGYIVAAGGAGGTGDITRFGFLVPVKIGDVVVLTRKDSRDTVSSYNFIYLNQ